MLTTVVNDYEDSSDEAEEDADIPDSDTEQDLVVFPSDEEDELELESDDESKDNEDSEDAEAEDNSDEHVEQSPQVERKSDKKKLIGDFKKDKKESVKTSVSKDKVIGGKEVRSVNKLKNQENSQSHNDDSDGSQETKIVSSTIQNQYDYDSSDEEDIRNTVGNIPMKWYDEYDHIGYDWEGKKIFKPEKGDELDNFLKRMEDPDFWRTIKDPQTGQDVVLKEDDIDLIVRIQKQKIPDAQFDEYAVS